MNHDHPEESVKLTGKLQERQLIEQFNKQCREAIATARRKHPEFANKVSIHDAYVLDSISDEYREYTKDNAIVYDILVSEVAAFLAELKRGDMERAQEEAAHVYAVMWRALCGEHLHGQSGEDAK